jgi:hypothetical protein
VLLVIYCPTHGCCSSLQDAPALQTSAPFNASAAYLGGTFTPSQWSAWFTSYSAFIRHHANLCAKAAPRCVGLVLADELLSAFQNVPASKWRALARGVRAMLPAGAALTVITTAPEQIDW